VVGVLFFFVWCTNVIILGRGRRPGFFAGENPPPFFYSFL
jgi:hypothetical protein